MPEIPAGLIAIFVGLGLALDNWAALAVLAVLPTVGLRGFKMPVRSTAPGICAG